MKVDFEVQDKEQILSNIKEAMGGRALAKMVDFDLSADEMVVTISKMGKSKLFFSAQESDAGITYTLTKEKIAFSHKAFKGEVTEKIVKVIQKAGGKVTDS